jgi:hypothetical protein
MSALSKKFAMIRERRVQACEDAKEDAAAAGMTADEKAWFMAQADNNAIWDGEAGRPYRRFPVQYKPAPVVAPSMYREMTYEDYKAQQQR